MKGIINTIWLTVILVIFIISPSLCFLILGCTLLLLVLAFIFNLKITITSIKDTEENKE